MLSIFKFRVHNHAKNFNALLWLNSLSFDSKRLIICFVRFASKIDDGCLFQFESCIASLFPFCGATNNYLYTFSVALCYRPCDPGCKVVYESYSTSIRIDPTLDQVCIEEEE
jgi:hypothetical protein